MDTNQFFNDDEPVDAYDDQEQASYQEDAGGETGQEQLSERLRILRMVEEGRISAQQGADLLETLGQNRKSRPSAAERPTNQPRWFRVRVTDTLTGRSRARVSIPLGLMDWGLKIGAQFAPEVAGVNINELGQVLRSGAGGKIIDVIDDEDGEHVEIFIE